MGWEVGYDNNWERDIGYGVPSICDHPDCNEEIDRGLSYVCGSEPYGGDHGCGLFFCSNHLRMAGEKRDNVLLCSKCYHGKCSTYVPKPDSKKWLHWKLTDESWKQWRDENPDEVGAIKDVFGRNFE